MMREKHNFHSLLLFTQKLISPAIFDILQSRSNSALSTFHLSPLRRHRARSKIWRDGVVGPTSVLCQTSHHQHQFMNTDFISMDEWDLEVMRQNSVSKAATDEGQTLPVIFFIMVTVMKSSFFTLSLKHLQDKI